MKRKWQMIMVLSAWILAFGLIIGGFIFDSTDVRIIKTSKAINELVLEDYLMLEKIIHDMEKTVVILEKHQLEYKKQLGLKEDGN